MASIDDLVLLRRAKDIIDREFSTPLNVEVIARDVGFSAGHFSRLFSAAYCEPPYSDLMTRRVERAMALLRHSERSVTERETIEQMMAKGTYAGVNLATPDLDAVFAMIEASGADIVQEPLDQDYGLRDCAVRDPAGNLIRIQQRP